MNHIIATSRSQLFEAIELKKAKAELRGKYRNQLEQATFVERLDLLWKMHHEARQAVNERLRKCEQVMEQEEERHFAEVQRRVMARHERTWQQAGTMRRLFLRWKIRRDIVRESIRFY